jgi:ribosomal protein L37AE/L43A
LPSRSPSPGKTSTNSRLACFVEKHVALYEKWQRHKESCPACEEFRHRRETTKKG